MDMIWKQILNEANKSLEEYRTWLEVSFNEDGGTYGVDIVTENDDDIDSERYADGYYEDELAGIIDDAWTHALGKVKTSRSVYHVATVVYNEDGQVTAESGVFSTKHRAMKWVEKYCNDYLEDLGMLADAKWYYGDDRIETWYDGSSTVSVKGTVSQQWKDNPYGYQLMMVEKNRAQEQERERRSE